MADMKTEVDYGKQRLSKLQKWILENCFRVTVLLDRTTLKQLENTSCCRKCKDCCKTSVRVRSKRNDNNIVTPWCIEENSMCSYFEFYKEDILLSFFLLEPKHDIAHFARVQHFHDSPDYAKAHVIVHRSINNLIEKGLIRTWNAFREESVKIRLTGEGMEKAAELLNISDYTSLFES